MHRLIIYEVAPTQSRKPAQPMSDEQLQSFINELAIGTAISTLYKTHRFPEYQCVAMYKKAGIQREIKLRRKEAWAWLKVQQHEADQIIHDFAMGLTLRRIAKRHRKAVDGIIKRYRTPEMRKRIAALQDRIRRQLWVDG